MTALYGVLPHLKALHIACLVVWVAGIVALPALLARHDRALGQADFARIRQATHYGFVWAITPAAVLAIGSGTLLIFLREVFTPWMFAKLVCVAALVSLHAWVGHSIIAVAETEGHHEPPGPLVPILAAAAIVTAILLLVLAKPELAELPLPGWLHQPLGRDLPFDVPNP